MSVEKRLHSALDKLSRGTSVLRSREYDQIRAQRRGTSADETLEAAVERLEEAADALWDAIKI